MNLIKTSQVILMLLPIITDVVKRVEAENTAPGAGKQKLKLALDLIEIIYEAARQEGMESFGSIKGKVEAIVASVVVFYNAIGAFKKAVKAA